MTRESLLESLETLELTPVSLRRIFLLFTRLHYSDPAHYPQASETLSKLVWSADPKLRTLFIDPDYNFQPKHAEQRPAIFVGLSDMDFSKVVQDNRDTETDDRSGVVQVYRASTSVIVRHVATSPDESLGLGDLSSIFFMGIRPLLMEHLSLGTFEVVKLMSTKPFLRSAEQADQLFTTDLVMPLTFTRRWTTFTESHRIKTVSFTDALTKYALPTTTD